MFGTHIRVHPFFWVVMALICWDLLNIGMEYLITGIICGFVSILLHEFGHIWVGRYFGSEGHIVLWAFGGLAIGSTDLRSRGQRIAVTIAGPAIQILLWAAFYFAEPYLLSSRFLDLGLLVILPGANLLEFAYRFLAGISLFWALLNLLPIWPLDGGWITRDVWGYFSPRNAVPWSLRLSIGVALLLALHAAVAEKGERIIPWVPVGYSNALFFGLFVFMGIQALQEENARDRWIDERTSWE
jgi:Zn-dependent protease